MADIRLHVPCIGIVVCVQWSSICAFNEPTNSNRFAIHLLLREKRNSISKPGTICEHEKIEEKFVFIFVIVCGVRHIHAAVAAARRSIDIETDAILH